MEQFSRRRPKQKDHAQKNETRNHLVQIEAESQTKCVQEHLNAH